MMVTCFANCCLPTTASLIQKICARKHDLHCLLNVCTIEDIKHRYCEPHTYKVLQYIMSTINTTSVLT